MQHNVYYNYSIKQGYRMIHDLIKDHFSELQDLKDEYRKLYASLKQKELN